jgi:hypothetical protein
MSRPLDGARLKVTRAREHLDSLVSELRTYRERNRVEVIPKQGATYEEGFIVKIGIPPPLRLSAIIGDCATNARAALDYTVWELAKRYFSPKLDTQKPSDRLLASFKISATATNYKHLEWLTKLSGRQIPEPVIDQIKSVQPYQTGDSSLLGLTELVNKDKHQAPVLTLRILSIELDDMGKVTVMSDGLRSVEANLVYSVTLPLRGSEFLITATRSIAGAQYGLVLDSHRDASLAGPIDESIDRILRCVESIIPLFEPYL